MKQIKELNLRALASTAIHQKKAANGTGNQYIDGIAFGIYFTLQNLGYGSERIKELGELFNWKGEEYEQRRIWKNDQQI